eukprot:SAG31_NODE_444_length_15625_cov_6.047469_3_plen_106_part_00
MVDRRYLRFQRLQQRPPALLFRRLVLTKFSYKHYKYLQVALNLIRKYGRTFMTFIYDLQNTPVILDPPIVHRKLPFTSRIRWRSLGCLRAQLSINQSFHVENATT